MKILALFLLLSSNLVLAADKTSENQLSFGAVVSGGNSQSSTYELNTENYYMVSPKNKLTYGGHYTYGKANDELAVRNYDVNVKTAHTISKNNSGYFGLKYEGDKFSGYEERENFDLGYQHNFIFSEKFTTKFEIGYRYVIEKDINQVTSHFNKVRLYERNKYVFNKTSSAELWVEYLHNVERSSDWMLSFAPSVNFLLTGNLFFKFSYQGDYRNEPVESGLKKYDYTLISSLLAKF